MVGEWVREAASVAVLTGAGISTDSGIADLRGPQGVWAKDPQAEAMSTLDIYVADPDVRRRAWRARRDHPSLGVQPAAGLCVEAVEYGARLVIISAQETPYDGVAEVVIREPIGRALPTLLSETP